MLGSLLQKELPGILQRVQNGEMLFPSHTGHQPAGKVYRCPPLPERVSHGLDDSAWAEVPRQACEETLGDQPGGDLTDWHTSWQALWSHSHLYVRVRCRDPRGIPPVPGTALRLFEREHLTVSIEPRRLWPGVHFTTDPRGVGHCDRIRSIPDAAWAVTTEPWEQGWIAHFTIPWGDLGERGLAPERLRINVQRVLQNQTRLSWVSLHPVPLRLYCFGTYNPTDFGWLFLEPHRTMGVS